MRHLLTYLATVCCVLTAVGTQTLLRDLEPGVDSSTPSDFTPLGDLVLFSAQARAVGAEVWRTDGTAAGTSAIDLLPGPGSGLLRPDLYAVDDVVLFCGSDGVRSGLFATDGTLAGTRFVVDLSIGGQPAELRAGVAVVEGRGYLTAWNAVGQGVLYRTDGTMAGTSVLRTLTGGTSYDMVGAGDRVFFSVIGANSELWCSDGTAAGTVRLVASASSWPEALTTVGDRVFFRERSAGLLSPLWVSDGTVAGTVAVPSLPPVYILSIVEHAGTAMVLTSPIGGAIDLWRSDATAAGTVHLAQLLAGSGGPLPAFGAGYAVAADDAVYVQVGGWQPSAWLWRSDGTTAGTTQFWPPGFRLRIYAGVTPIGNRLLFGSVYGAGGEEPWLTDGTTAGTRLLADLAAGDDSSRPRWFTLAANLAVGPTVFFAATDRNHGAEPWMVPAGVVGLATLRDVRPGCATAGPRPHLQAVGGLPQIGNATFGVRLRSVHANAPVALLLDVGLGAAWNGCATLLPASVALPAITDAGGASRFSMPVPNDATLVGRRVLLQPLIGVAGGFVLGLADLGAITALIVGA